MSAYRIHAALVATAMGVVLASPAMAQGVGSADDSAASSGDIIVTARRVEERLQDVPISITVLSADQLSDKNITLASDLGTYTPSLSVNERYGPEKSSFSLRGFNQDASTAPTVGVYFADVVGVRAQGGTTSGNTVGAGSFMDLQNVQILKGPQGTLQGRNTTGGAILLVPRKPTDNLEGYIEGTYGNLDQRRVQGAVNIPLADTFKVRFAADRMVRDGYMRNRSGIGPKDYNDRNYFAARLSVVANLTPDLENYTIATYSKSDTNGYAAHFRSCNRAAVSGTLGLTATAACAQVDRQNARGDGLRDVEVSNPDPFLKLTTWQVINTTTWNASDTLTIKNIASYGEFRERSHFNLYSDNFVVSPRFLTANGGGGLGSINPQLAGLPLVAGTPFKYIVLDTAPGQENSAQSTATEELQLQGNSADGRLRYVIGGYLEFSRPLGYNAGRTGIFLNCTRPQDLTCANPLFLGTISESSTKFDFDNHGVFAQGTFNFTDQLSVTAGGRYTFDKIAGISRSTRASLGTVRGNPAASFADPATGVIINRKCTDSFRYGAKQVIDQSECATSLTNKSNKPTWLIDVDFKPTQDILLYAKYARGYRQGGINFTNPGVETWQPESVDAYEIGEKFSFRGENFSGYINAAGFYNSLKQAQIFASLISGDPSVSGGAAIVNAGKARSYGAEVDASVLMFRSLRVSASYAYLDTKVQSVEPAATLGDGSALAQRLVGTPFVAIIPTVTQGSAFTLAPKHKLTVSGEYTLPLPETAGELSIGATYTYTSNQNSNRSVPAFVSGLPLGFIPSYSLLNLNVNWNNVAGSPFDLAVFATNVTNKLHATNTGGGYTSSGIGDVLLAEPRIYGVRLRYSFGQ